MAKKYQFAFKRLDVYRLAVAHFDWTCEVTARMPKAPFKLTDQAIGASSSIMGNIGEANGRDKAPGEVEQHYRYSQGSTFESATHLDAFSSLNAITDEEYNAEEQRLARIAAMLTKLMQRQRQKARAARQRRHTRPAQPGAVAANAAQPASSRKPGIRTGRGTANPRASGVPAGAKRPAGIEPSRSEVPARPQGAAGIESRGAGPRGSEAPKGDRTPSNSSRLK